MKLFVFRKYDKPQGKRAIKHPKLIVDDRDDEYGFMGLTSSKKKGRGHNNIPLSANPQQGRKTKAYLRRKIEYDYKELFGEILKDYKLSEIDKINLIDYIEKHKKR